MTPESQTNGATAGKHVYTATDTHTTIEKLFEAVFSIRSTASLQSMLAVR